jgi:hypothetical protein
MEPTTVVAIDFGTSCTGYCIAQAPPPGAPLSSARVYPFKPGDRSASATEKNVTAVLLDARSRRVVAFGREARRRFFDLDADAQRGVLFLEQFKMVMSPSRRGAVPLSQRSVHALGADVAVPLADAVAAVLGAVAAEAADRLRSLGVAPADVAWVVTVPAIWDDEAKALMREASVRAGIVRAEGAPAGAAGAATAAAADGAFAPAPSRNLLLCLEPEGAIVASMADASADLQRRLVKGSGVMILDCGGGTVDVTVSEVSQTPAGSGAAAAAEPYALREILPASGDAWGGTIVDAEARRFFNAMLCPPGTRIDVVDDDGDGDGGGDGGGGSEGSSGAAAAALNAIMDSWESAKSHWDPEDPQRATVKVDGLASIASAVGGPEVMQRRVAAFNEANGLFGADAVVYRPRSFALVLPCALVRSFFDACVSAICAHVLRLFQEADELGAQIQFVFLVGGFAESVYLQRAVRAALCVPSPDGDPGKAVWLAEVIVPNKPVQVVNRGSAIWGLSPTHFITSRVCKYTYAVELIEAYDPLCHEPLPSPDYIEKTPEGRYCRHVLVPLAQRGDVVSVDERVEQLAHAINARQTSMTFHIYRLPCRLPPMSMRVRRALVIRDSLPAQPPRAATRPPPQQQGGAGGAGASALPQPAAGTVLSTISGIGYALGILPVPRRVRRRRRPQPALRAGGATDPFDDNDLEEALLGANDGPDLSLRYPDTLPALFERDRIASVTVECVPTEASVVSLFFGRTELSVVARNTTTNKEAAVKLSWEKQ